MLETTTPPEAKADAHKLDWRRVWPFIGMHGMVLGVCWTGYSAVAVGIAAWCLFWRLFAVTGFYHRYFSHKAFKTSRVVQFVFAVLGTSAVQRGPLWWAAHHRQHHAYADTPQDVHSPLQHGFWWSHIGWFLSYQYAVPDYRRVKELSRFAELRWLDRYNKLIPCFMALALYGLGSWLARVAPGLGTSGAQMLMWGFFISTVVVYHLTYTINSLCHCYGTRRFATTDQSRNNVLLALLTLGEGWHNNHHYYPAAARQGFFWWEVDLTFYLLTVLSWVRLIWDLKPVPQRLLRANVGARAPLTFAGGQS